MGTNNQANFSEARMLVKNFLDTTNIRGALMQMIKSATVKWETAKFSSYDEEMEHWLRVKNNLETSVAALELIAEERDPEKLAYEVINNASRLASLCRQLPQDASVIYVSKAFCGAGNKKRLEAYDALDAVKIERLMPKLRKVLVVFWNEFSELLKTQFESNIGSTVHNLATTEELSTLKERLLTPLRDLSLNPKSTLFLQEKNSKRPIYEMEAVLGRVIEIVKSNTPEYAYNHSLERLETARSRFKTGVVPQVKFLQECKDYKLNQGVAKK